MTSKDLRSAKTTPIVMVRKNHPHRAEQVAEHLDQIDTGSQAWARTVAVLDAVGVERALLWGGCIGVAAGENAIGRVRSRAAALEPGELITEVRMPVTEG